MELTEEDRELIPFSNATFRVYSQITGALLSALGGPVVDAVLHEVARALANIATIYGARTDTEPLKQLPVLALKHGTFLRAAQVARTSQGIEYGRLYIRRGDVRSAVTLLKNAGARFASAEEAAAALDNAEVRHELRLRSASSPRGGSSAHSTVATGPSSEVAQ
jgi:hypothetical protein